MSDDDLLKTPEAAAYLGVAPATLRGARNRGVGPSIAVGYGKGGINFYRRSDLDKFKKKPGARWGKGE